MNWGIYGLGILSGLAIKFLGDILSPTIAELGTRIRNRIWKNNKPKIVLPEDYSLLESLEKPLLKINQIPSFPDSLTALDIGDILIEIGTKAQNIESDEFLPIREKLLLFSSHANELHANMNVLSLTDDILGRNTAMTLVLNIRKAISKGIENRKKKGKKKK